MKPRQWAAAIVFALAACGEQGGDPFNGPVKVGVDPLTNYQETAVTRDSLDRTVDAVLWRGKDGGLAFHLVTPAYAQVAVDGAPVPGALVNAVPVGDCGLTPWNPAAVTDADGKARFWFEPGRKAGLCRAEIRYTDGATRVVTDTAFAVVEPGPVRGGFLANNHLGFRYQATAGAAVDVRPLFESAADEYGNAIALDSAFFATVAWAVYHLSGGAPDPTLEEATRSAVATIPADWCSRPGTTDPNSGTCSAGLMLWADTVYFGGLAFDVK